MKKLFFILILPFLLHAQQKGILTVEELWKMKRIETFDVSPDAKTIAFAVTSYSMEENKGNTDIYLIDSDGKNFRALKNSVRKESEPKFSPDGKKIAYIMDDQIWMCNIDGTGDWQLKQISTGASGVEWSSDGKKLLFISSVYPDCKDDECNKKKDQEKEQSKIKATIFTELMYRHWNDWRGDKRSHLFLFDLDNNNYVDLTLKSKFDMPPIALGSSNDYSFSPDNAQVSYTMNTDEMLAVSTNNDVFIADLKGMQADAPLSAKRLSEGKGNDNQPVYSPDGNYIAFVSMKRAGYEADKQEIILYDRKTGQSKNLSEDFNLSAAQIIWSPDSKIIYFTAMNEINNSIFKLDIASGKINLFLKENVNSEITISKDGKTIFFKRQRSDLPYEIFAVNSDGSNVRQITSVNADLLSSIEMNPTESFWSDGADGAKVQSILIKPPFFDPSKKYPLIFLIHGGPQGHWNDEFHYRWNTQMFAAQGYVVIAPNPRGSTGYGQKFTDEISGDWGGKAYIDLMNTYDYALNNFNFIDGRNTFAAGASYGGYMINWIEGHTDRFNALVSHAGVFNLESEWGTTEELWFPEWENKGTPWENRELYEKWSPHRYIHNAKTPMLIVHGAKDFRVPEEQAFQLFTSLQRLGVESRFLYFPDEYHFVTKPQNARLWWNTIFDWYDKHKKEVSNERP